MHTEISFICQECNNPLSIECDALKGAVIIPLCKACKEEATQEGFEEGENAGYEEGFNDGHQAGYDEGVGDEYYRVMQEVREVLSQFLDLPPELHAAIEAIGE